MDQTAINTKITVRVIARDGKFLADDIGGSQIIIRDALNHQLLAEGVTRGTSGPNGDGGLMCVRTRRGQPLPATGASQFTAELLLDRPRRIEIVAYGPLGARGSANTVSATQWIYPGKDLTGGNGFVLEMPGLIVQIVNPVTHYSPSTLRPLEIRANVAMMCGCPISFKTGASKICPSLPDEDQPWLPNEFEVMAVVSTAGDPVASVRLAYEPLDTPGQFLGVWSPAGSGSYEIAVYAYQQAVGNTGVDFATVVVP